MTTKSDSLKQSVTGRAELVKALVQFQSKCPPVAHDKTGQIGQRTYTYASLGQIISAIREPLWLGDGGDIAGVKAAIEARRVAVRKPQ